MITTLFVFLCIVLIIISAILFIVLINRILSLMTRWDIEWKDRVLDWYWLKKKQAALRRIEVNKFKLQRLSEVEEIPTPEMLSIVNKITKDVNFVNSYTPKEESEDEKAEPITDEKITMASLICNKIDEMVIMEVQNLLLPLASVGTGIDVRNYADYIQTVATAVQAGLNIGIYKTDTIFKPEYINSYIVKKSAVMVLTTMTSLNKDLPPTT